MCVVDGKDEADSECEYFECETEHGGDCWVEKCNIEDKCLDYMCTQWEYIAEKNFWKATDCTPKKPDYSRFHRFFEAISHYEESWNALQDIYCEEGDDCINDAIDGLLNDIKLHPITNNEDDINDFLASEGQVEFANTVVKDTQEWLDAYKTGIDLDWMHTALSADNTDQLLDMIDNFWSDGNHEDEEMHEGEKDDHDHDEEKPDREDEENWSDKDEYDFDEMEDEFDEFDKEFEEGKDEMDKEFDEMDKEFDDMEEDFEKDLNDFEEEFEKDFEDFDKDDEEELVRQFENVFAWGDEPRKGSRRGH